MKNSLKNAWAVAKINFCHLAWAYTITVLFVAVGVWNIISCLTGLSDNNYVDMANYLYMLAVFAPIFIVARNFKRIMYLNGNKRDFYRGTLLNYGLIAAAVSFAGIIIFVLTNVFFGSRLVIWNLADIFGWWDHGVIIAFIQQFFFLLLVEVFAHTLTSIQARWYGWVTDVVLVAVISFFIPIPALRNLLVSFFNMIIFHSNALVQIIGCLLLSVGMYALDWLVLQRRNIS